MERREITSVYYDSEEYGVPTLYLEMGVKDGETVNVRTINPRGMEYSFNFISSLEDNELVGFEIVNVEELLKHADEDVVLSNVDFEVVDEGKVWNLKEYVVGTIEADECFLERMAAGSHQDYTEEELRLREERSRELDEYAEKRRRSREQAMTAPDGRSEVIMFDDCEHVYCPVCGTLTEVYDICDECGWQNTGETNIDGGPNEMTLAEARKAYAKGLPLH